MSNTVPPTPFPQSHAQVNFADDYDVMQWALVMRVDTRAVRDAAARVGVNVWAIWQEIQSDPVRYPRGTDLSLRPPGADSPTCS